jgi:anti-sigma factor RsiW
VLATEGVAGAWTGDVDATAVAVAAGSLAAAWLADAGALWLAGETGEPEELWLAHPAASTVTAVTAVNVKRRVTEVIDPPMARSPACCL